MAYHGKEVLLKPSSLPQNQTSQASHSSHIPIPKPSRPVRKTSIHIYGSQGKPTLKYQAKSTPRVPDSQQVRKKTEYSFQKNEVKDFLPACEELKRPASLLPDELDNIVGKVKKTIKKEHAYQLSPDMSMEDMFGSTTNQLKRDSGQPYVNVSSEDIHSESMAFETFFPESDCTKSLSSMLEQSGSFDEVFLLDRISEYLKRVQDQSVEDEFSPPSQNIDHFGKIKPRLDDTKRRLSIPPGKSLAFDPEKRTRLSSTKISSFSSQLLHPFESSDGQDCGDTTAFDLQSKDSLLPSTLQLKPSSLINDLYKDLRNSHYLQKKSLEEELDLSSMQLYSNLENSSNDYGWWKHDAYSKNVDVKKPSSYKKAISTEQPVSAHQPDTVLPVPTYFKGSPYKAAKSTDALSKNISPIVDAPTGKPVRTSRQTRREYVQNENSVKFTKPSRNGPQRYESFNTSQKYPLSHPHCERRASSFSHFTALADEAQNVAKNLKGWDFVKQRCDAVDDEDLKKIETHGFHTPLSKQNLKKSAVNNENDHAWKSASYKTLLKGENTPENRHEKSVQTISHKILDVNDFKHSNVKNPVSNNWHKAFPKNTEIDKKEKALCTVRASPPLLRNARKRNQPNSKVTSRKPVGALDKANQPGSPNSVGRHGQKVSPNAETFTPTQPAQSGICGKNRTSKQNDQSVFGSKKTCKARSKFKTSSGIPKLIRPRRILSPKPSSLPSHNKGKQSFEPVKQSLSQTCSMHAKPEKVAENEPLPKEEKCETDESTSQSASPESPQNVLVEIPVLNSSKTECLEKTGSDKEVRCSQAPKSEYTLTDTESPHSISSNDSEIKSFAVANSEMITSQDVKTSASKLIKSTDKKINEIKPFAVAHSEMITSQDVKTSASKLIKSTDKKINEIKPFAVAHSEMITSQDVKTSASKLIKNTDKKINEIKSFAVVNSEMITSQDVKTPVSKLIKSTDKKINEIKQLDKEPEKKNSFSNTRNVPKHRKPTRRHPPGEKEKEKSENKGYPNNTNDLLAMFTKTLGKVIWKNQECTQKNKKIKNMKIMLKIGRSKKNVPPEKEVRPENLDTTTDTVDIKSDDKKSKLARKENPVNPKNLQELEIESDIKETQERESGKPGVDNDNIAAEDEKLCIFPVRDRDARRLRDPDPIVNDPETKEGKIGEAFEDYVPADAQVRRKESFLHSKPPTLLKTAQKRTARPPSTGLVSSVGGISDNFYSLYQNTENFGSQSFSSRESIAKRFEKSQATSHKKSPLENREESSYAGTINKSSDSMVSHYLGERPPSLLKFLVHAKTSPSTFRSCTDHTKTSRFRSHVARWRFILFIILLPIALSFFSTYFYLRI